MYILFNTSRRPPSEQLSYWVLQLEPDARPESPSPFINQAQAGNRCVERNDFYTGGQSSSPVSEPRLMSGVYKHIYNFLLSLFYNFAEINTAWHLQPPPLPPAPHPPTPPLPLPEASSYPPVLNMFVCWLIFQCFDRWQFFC